MPITNTQLQLLSKFHIDNLRRFQSLPTRTATCAVYLLIGVLPIEAELHKRQLSLLYNLLVSTNETIVELNNRQIAVNLDNSLSFYSRVQKILDTYQLPSLQKLQTDIPTKEQWKILVKRAVNEFLTDKLSTEAVDKSTLCYLNIEPLKIGQTHPLWSSLESTVSDVRKGITRCRMITGTYMLQSIKSKFSKSSVKSTCNCCGLNEEDLPHMLLECPALIDQRKVLYPELKSLVIDIVGIRQWNEIFTNRNQLVQLILDCTVFTALKESKNFLKLQRISTELCHRPPSKVKQTGLA